MSAVKMHYLDASALVKLKVNEHGSSELRKFFNTNTNFRTTGMCLAEALSAIKKKWERREIAIDEYFSVTRGLLIEASGGKIEIDKMELLNWSVQDEVQKMARKHELDLSDALQLVTISKGKYSYFTLGSQSVLITADKQLETAAAKEGIRVWHCIEDPKPPW